jgi:DeoR/GlpR family transcriptional regulator of sugar metabolism
MKIARSIIRARRQSLARMIESHHYLPLSEVCLRLGISPATARRDLRALASEKKITRTHGGALGRFDATFASFADRRALDHDVKMQLAERAREFILSGMTCFFDAGTTIFALAELLHHEPVSDLCAITNSLPAAEMLGRCQQIEVHLLGGRFLQRQSLLLGAEARDSAREWKFDLVFLGAEGFSRGGIWASEPEVAAFQRVLLARAKKVVICAAAAKLNRETGVFLAPWKPKFELITNADFSP